MSQYYYACCRKHKLIVGSSTSHGGELAAGQGLLHHFIAEHVHCGFDDDAPGRAPMSDYPVGVSIVDEGSWEKEQATCELNGWRYYTKEDINR